MTVLTFAKFALACFATTACGGVGYGASASSATGPAAPAAPDQVNATPSLAFDPSALTTKVGHTVTFAFGSVGHNIFFDTAQGAPADIPGINTNTSVPRIFNTAGTFTYTCHIHPFMRGTVVVQ